MQKLGAWAFALTLGASSPAVAQQASPLGDPALRRYVGEVLERNAGLAAAQTEVRAAEERIAPAGSLPDPALSFGVMQILTTSFDPRASDFTNFPIRLQQTFPFPGKQGRSEEVARKETEVAASSLSLTEHSLAAEAARAFFELAYARGALAVWRERVGLADQAVRVTLARYETGSAPQTEVLRAQVRRVRLEELGYGLAAEVQAAAARADALRGGAGEPLTVPDLSGVDSATLWIMRQESLPDLDVLQQEQRARSPLLSRANAEVERARASARLFAIAARPDFMVSVEYGPRIGHPDFFTGMIGWSVPLFAGRKQAPAAEAARLDLTSSQRRREDVQVRLEGELRARTARLDALRQRIEELRERVLRLAEAASASALQSYSVGAVDLTTVLDAQDDLFQARLDLARLAADYGAERAALSALLGEEWYR